MIGPRPLLPEDQPTNTPIRLSVRPGISGWAQVNGAKLVTKEEKQQLDEWYVHNASLWVDVRIAMMTIKLVLKGRVSSQEMLADTEQVQSKAACGFACSSPAFIVPPQDNIRTSALMGEAQQISAKARHYP